MKIDEEISYERRNSSPSLIGFISAYYLAKNGVYYSNGSANNLTHRTFEAIQYL